MQLGYVSMHQCTKSQYVGTAKRLLQKVALLNNIVDWFYGSEQQQLQEPYEDNSGTTASSMCVEPSLQLITITAG
jgi:hypothetical protein